MTLIACIGDSLTYNNTYQKFQAYPSQIARMTGCDFINAGIGGQTSTQMLARFQSDVLSYNPDYVMIMAGINDIGASATAEQIEANLASMVAQALAWPSVKKVFLHTITPYTISTAQTVNAWILTQGTANVIITDTWTPLYDGGGENNFIAKYHDAGTGPHINPLGMHKLAKVILASAQAAGLWTNVKFWANTAAGNASTGTWKDAAGNTATAPVAGDRLVLDEDGVQNCVVDQTLTYGGLQQAVGYTGTTTYPNGFNYQDCYIEAGTATPTDGKLWTYNGDTVQNGGTFGALDVHTTGDGVLSLSPYFVLNSLHNSGNLVVSVSSGSASFSVMNGGIVNDAGAHLTMNAQPTLRAWNGYTGLVNSGGTIDGTYDIWIDIYNGTPVIKPGNCSVGLFCYLSVSSTTDRTIAMSPDWAGSTGRIKVWSNHASYVLTLDTAGYSITAPQLIEGVRGKFLFGTARHIIGGSIDTSGGLSDYQTCTIVQTGGTIKTAGAAQPLYNVEAPVAPLNLASDVVITGTYRHLRPAVLNGHVLTFDPAKEIRMMEDMSRLQGSRARTTALLGSVL